MNNKRKNKVERELYKNIGWRLLLERMERR